MRRLQLAAGHYYCQKDKPITRIIIILWTLIYDKIHPVDTDSLQDSSCGHRLMTRFIMWTPTHDKIHPVDTDS